MFELHLNGMSLLELVTGERPDNTRHGMEHVHESRRGNLEEKAKTAQRLMQHGGLSEKDIRTTFHLDGKRAGSVARFINHNDEPNLSIAMVMYDHHDIRLAHLCLFANTNIPPLTELCYDYGTDYSTKLLADRNHASRQIGSR
uniref:SET domain-containing protein n=1 Tax=Pyramimonas obovata TaxID=1411642 RepID=A0A7S0R7N2_9CHLO|mmetsp:Transcript_27650/g.60423  ORF Transcript_27650/g.60423 Transcript_27650/m.60423 type:complete len:143 (+) Transcript_27650:94-522(+)